MARILAWLGLLVTICLGVTGTALYWGATDFALGVLVWTMTLASSVTGLLVVLRRPDHRVGWLLAAQGPVTALVLWADGYLQQGWIDDPGSLPGLGWVALWSTHSWPPLFLQLATIGYLFPDGHPLGPRWRRWQRSTSLAYPLIVLGGFWVSEPFPAPYTDIPHPLPVAPTGVSIVFSAVVMPLLAGHLVGSALSARARFRRSSGISRQQLLWFAWAAVLVPASLLLCVLDNALNGTETALTLAGIALGGTLVPLAIGVAILRHQLFDIELVLSRTLLYAGLAASVAAIYAAGVYGLGTLLSNRGLAGFVAVVVVAVAADPLRVRLRCRAERWVYGDRADPYLALVRLGDRLQATLAPDEALRTVVDTVREALRAQQVAIELLGADGPRIAASAGRSAGRERVRVPLDFQGAQVGALVVEGDTLSAADERLLSGLARHAGVALHAVRLSADLQRSRERLVNAQEEERRRLRRDLHDGLGPELAAIVMQVDGARMLATDERLSGVLAQIAVQTRTTIADIRRLVEGLRPPALDELGLLGSLRQQAARLSNAPVVIDVSGPEHVPALPAAVEVAAYRIAVEAMTNVVRHAGAHRCVVEVSLNGHLEVAVRDNGRGVPDVGHSGVGLPSMQERAAELGGTCTVSARPEGGTEVHAVPPVPR